MATGSTTDFELSRDQIIAHALVNVGALGPGKEATGRLRSYAAETLDRVVKGIDTEGNFLWRVIRRSFTTTDGTAAYSPATDVIAIDCPMNYKRAGQNSRSVILPMSRDDFMALSDRTSESTPTHYFVEKTLSGLSVTFWPVPAATGDAIEYAACLRSKDFDTGANTPDFPSEWTNCLVYGLSAELAPGFNQFQQAAYFRGLFDAEKSKLLNAETEHGNLILMPWGYS